MKTQSQYIKQLHILFNRCNINESGKEAIYNSYGVTSSKQLTIAQLIEICNKLHQLLQRDGKEQVPVRRKTPLQQAQTCCKLAIGSLLAAQGKIPPSDWKLAQWHLIQTIACRAASVEHFGQIPLSKLRGIAYEFNKQAKAIAQAKQTIHNLK